MKKVFLFLASAMFCVVMASCGGNNEAADSTAIDTIAPVEETEIQTPAEPVATDNDARQQAIMDAAQQICNCGDLLNCVNTVIDQSFAQYAQDEEFKAAVKEEAKKCIAEKAKQKGMEKANEAAKEGASKAVNELTKKLGK
ncbi:MAG: hypothetical protein IIY87_02795 [Bacteroidales bacterium]|nr:hypothetical protein [Bacteroidales bacterium]